MKKIVGLWGLLLYACIPVFSQIDTTYIYNTAMPYGTLDVRIAKSATRYYYLQEDITFSYRESEPGVKTNTYRDMTSWNSAPYRQGNLREKNGNADQFVMNYRFLLPNNYNASYAPGYPILIMFHGLGERGNCWDENCYWSTPGWNPNTNSPPAPTSSLHNLLNNDHNLLHGGLKHLNAVNLAGSKLPNDPTLSPNAFPGIVVFPQNLNGWGQVNKIEDAIRLLRLMIKKYNGDENRVYIHGLSNGGGAVFQAIKRAPWLFAAALPMSAINNGGIVTDGLLGETGKIPLWIFQGGKDANPTPSKTYNTVKNLRETGANVRYYLYSHLGHGTWNTAYSEPDFFSWILAKRKYNPHIYYGNPVICNTTGVGVRISFSNGFPAYQWEHDGEIISGESQSLYIANTPGTYRGRFSRVLNPTENDWQPWSEPILVTEINPVKPTIQAIGSTHLRGPGLANISANNTVSLKSQTEADLYDWYKDGVLIDFALTDVDDTLRTATFNSSNTSSNGAYTLVSKYSYCPSPPSDPVNLFFNNSAPQNITFNPATADFKGTVVSSGVFLTWNDLVNNEIGYEIWRKKSDASNFVFAGKTEKDAISFYDGPLEPTTTYLYKIRAVSKTGASNYVPSNDLNINYSITTAGDHILPSPPQNLTMTANTIGSITLLWQTATDNTGIKEYIINYGSNSVSTITNQTTFTISGLPPNTEYPVTIKAVDFAGHISQPSNQIIASTYVLGLYYKHSTGAWVDLDDPTLTATWDSPEFTGKVNNFTLTPRTQEDFFNFQFTGYLDILAEGDYIFRLASDDGSRLTMDNSLLIDNNGTHGNVAVLSDTVHLFAGPHPLKVDFFDYAGTQTLSVQWKGPDLTTSFAAIPDSLLRSGKFISTVPPAAPFNLAAQGNGMQRIDLNWQNSISAEVEIYRASSVSGTYNIIGRTGVSIFADTIDLFPGATYYYKVRAVTSSGLSAFSAVVSAATTIDNVVPSVPSSIQLATKTHTHIAITWAPSTDNVNVAGYEVFSNGQLVDITPIPAIMVTGLQPNTNYTLTVRALDANGNRSALSAGLAVTTNPSATYYSMATGNLNASTTWKQNADGTGNSPETFTESGQYFIISNRTQTAMGGAWDVSGSGSKVIIPSNVTFTADHAFSGKVELEGTATLNLNHTLVPELQKLSLTSTVNFSVPSIIPLNAYGNVMLTGTGPKTFSEGITSIAGNLTIANGLTIKGMPGNASSLILNGNLSVPGITEVPAADNRIAIHFTNDAVHSISAGDDLYFYKLTSGGNATINLQNAGTSLKVVLGSLNGGGLSLANGSTFNMIDNTLMLVNAGTINSQSETGRLSFNGGDLKVSSEANINSNLYFDPVYNVIDTLLADLSGSGDMIIQQPAKITSALKIKSGEVHANGKITLVSTSLKTAVIAAIENGNISGNVFVQHYLAPLGDSWRDLSTSVTGVTVASWQTYFPITGQFTGTSGGVDPSMFISNGTGLIAYPTPGGSNQAPIERGRGYVTRITNPNPTTLQVSGNPFQGNISFDLNSGSGGGVNNGWNLVGNPYASSVIWNNNNEGWVKTSVSQTIAVRENKVLNGQSVSQYNYFTPALGDALIRSGQAFWVQTFGLSPVLTITEKAKATEQSLSPQPTIGLSYLVVTLQQGSVSDATYILFTSEGTDAFDNMFDGLKKSNEGMFNLSSIVGVNTQVAVNFLPNSFCSKVVKLNISNVSAGNYSLNFGALASLTDIGNVTLTDNFTGTVANVGATPYSFSVTSDPNSYGGNRFSLTFSRNQLDVTTPQVQAEDICDEDEAFITILRSQPGVEYAILNDGDQVISAIVEGGTETLLLPLDKSKLNSGQNHIRVRAGFKGCSTQTLSAQASFTHTPSFTINSQPDVSICLGEMAMLQVSGISPGGYYEWFDENNIKINGQQSSTLTTAPLRQETVFHVRGVSVNGCNSVMETIHVYADTLAVPVITLYNDTLFTQVEAQYQWKKDGQPIIGATAPFYKPAASGNYTVMAYGSGCSKESKIYEYVIDPNCKIDTATPLVSANPNCGKDVVPITITKSQAGVVYRAMNENDIIVSSPVTGNGGTVVMELAESALDQGVNNVYIKADMEGCADRRLSSVATFNNLPGFTVTTKDTVLICEGATATLNAAGAPPDGHYIWYDSAGAIIPNMVQQTYTTGVISLQTRRFVSAVHPIGCESEKKIIRIIPQIIQTPVVESQEGSLVVNNTGSYQWKKNGELISGAVAFQYTPVTAGEYTVVVTQGNCSKESAPFAFNVTATGEVYAGEFGLHVYPVPATSANFRMRVQSPKPELVKIEIIDITGRVVFRKSYNVKELVKEIYVNPVQGSLADGMYCVIATQGKMEIRRRVIIKN